MVSHWLTVRLSLFNLPLLGIVLLSTISGLSAWADSTTVPAQSQLEQAIEQYIRSHPETIEQALKTLEATRLEAQKARIAQTIASYQNELLHDPDSPVSGNPSGDVTVIEFFDYRCGYCKRVATAVTKLQQGDPGVRIVYKDFPILGDTSVFAARAALAAQMQGKHQVFHEAMLASAHDLTQAEVLSIADQVGLNRMQLESDMSLPKWDSVIDRNRDLAEVLTIAGTPGFIIGGELHPGALGLQKLEQLVNKARSK